MTLLLHLFLYDPLAKWDFINLLKKPDEGVCNFQTALQIGYALYMIESAVTAQVL